MMSTRTYIRKKPIPETKKARISRIKELLKKYDKFIVIDIADIPANLMKELRKKLWGWGELIVIKNTLLRKALLSLPRYKKNISKFESHLNNMRALFFTNRDIFEVASIINSIKERLPPKPGKPAPEDIIIPKGNTGLRPGPAMTDLRVAGLPIRIIDGEIWILNNHNLVPKGKKISAQAAKVMAILDILPFEVGPKVIMAWDRNLVIPRKLLLMPLEEYSDLISRAYASAVNIAVETTLPTVDAIEQILIKAYASAVNIAVETTLPTVDAIEQILIKAYTVSYNLMLEGSKLEPNLVTDEIKFMLESSKKEIEEKEEKKEEKKEKKKEEKKEEEEFTGLAALFG
ncbi:MAG: 50S ribosomal protein L10 [Candidatus Njordarchaeum guaymaensis]